MPGLKYYLALKRCQSGVMNIEGITHLGRRSQFGIKQNGLHVHQEKFIYFMCNNGKKTLNRNKKKKRKANPYF